MNTLFPMQAGAEPFVPESPSLTTLAAALPACKGCEIHCNGTRPVFGEGPAKAALMLVGEQPGDHEERRGRPFVGPAGAVLDGILRELEVPREEVYVTNAVKHFKFTLRGKFRLHENPRVSEINACRPWLAAELELVRPRVVVCLGASAAKSLIGGAFSLMKDHGRLITSQYADQVYATLHPSAILRAFDEDRRQELHAMLRLDLERAWLAARHP